MSEVEEIPQGLVEVARIPLGALKQEVLLLKHEETGMHVAVCKLPGPLCQMDVIVPTECTNNKGLPHCLEHLVFMGSAQYPQRGFLDKLANLCLAQGTNAWTDKDHTAYNAVTAGYMGLLKLIPVFLDHVMHPTLTEAQFATEIYHVDGEGKQNGVVFCEMQGREATEDDMLDYAMHRLVYPQTGYQYECGGLTPDIATLNNALVREYHSSFYRPENAFLLVHGQVPLRELAAAIDSWSCQRKLAAAPAPPSTWRKPWSEVPPSMSSSSSKVVEFPAEDESVGSVGLSWSGPHIGDSYACIALEILLRYLQEGAASPIAQKFVECADPWASGVEFDVELRLRTCISLSFSGVPNADGAEDDEEEGEGGDDEEEDEEEGEDSESGSDDDDDDDDGDSQGEGAPRDDLLTPGVIRDELLTLLKGVMSGKDTLTKEEMGDAVRRHRLKLLEECEEEPADALHNYLLPELLFREQIASLGAGKFRSRLDQEAALKELETKDSDFWKALLEEWIIKAPCAEVVMIPSKKLAKERSDAEAASTAARRKEMGEAGLKAAKEALDMASEESAPKPLPDTFPSPPLPPSSTIARLPMTAQLTKMPRTGTPVQVVRLATNFYHISICLDAGSLPAHLRPYLVMLREMLLSSPVVLEDGTRIDYKDVVKAVQKDTVSAGCSLSLTGSATSGRLGGVFQFSGVSLPGPEGYRKLCDWASKVLFRVEFDENRVETCVQNMHKDMTTALRDGSTVCSTLMQTLTCPQLAGPSGEGEGFGENDIAACLFKQKPFIGGLKAGIKAGKGVKEAVRCLEELRLILTSRGPPVMIQIGAPEGSEGVSGGLEEEIGGLLEAGMSHMREVGSKKKADGRGSKRRRGGKAVVGSGEKLRGQSDTAIDVRLVGGVRRWNVEEQCVVTPVDGIESSYVEQSVPCCVHRRHVDYMPIYFLAELLSRSEGPLWVGIRGKGYAYHASLELGVMSGLLYFTLGECGSPTKAVEVFHEILRDVPGMLASPEAERAMAETRAAIMYSLHSRRSTASGVMHQAMKSYFSGAESPSGDLDLEIERLAAVGVDDLMRVWEDYFKPFLTPGVRCTAIACVGKKGDEIALEMGKFLGVKADVRSVDDLLIKT